MLTRRLVHRGLLWAGLCIGAAALLGYALSLFVSIYHERIDRIIYFGRGALSVNWAIDGPSGAAAPPPGWHAESPGTRDWRFFPRCTDPDPTRVRIGGGPGLFVIPYWLPLGVGLLAGYGLLPKGISPNAKPRCPGCRFDLSGAPVVEVHRVHLRCPECGTISDHDEPTKPA